MKVWWRKVIRDYFTFSTGERNGVIVLCIAILIAAFAPRIIPLFQKEEPTDFTQFRKEIDSFQKNLQAHVVPESLAEKPSLTELDETQNQEKVSASATHLFSFDPN